MGDVFAASPFIINKTRYYKYMLNKTRYYKYIIKKIRYYNYIIKKTRYYKYMINKTKNHKYMINKMRQVGTELGHTQYRLVHGFAHLLTSKYDLYIIIWKKPSNG